MEIKLQGADVLARALRALPEEACAPKIILAAMRAEARPMTDAIRDAAPVDSGRLRLFISQAASLRKGRARLFIGALRMSRRNFEKNNLSSNAYYAAWTEYGSRFQRGQHWMLHAVQKETDGYLSRYLDRLSRLIERAAAKYAK